MNADILKLANLIREMNLKDGTYTHSYFGTFKVTQEKLDLKN